MLFLAAGIAVFRVQVPPSEALTLIGSGLTGIGLGATVAPALFVAGFSLPSANLQRVFAIVELLRAVAAFMIAPIFAHLALTVGGSLEAGDRDGALDRPRTRDRGRGARRRALPARRRAPADAGPRPLPRRRRAGVVFAAAARQAPRTAARRGSSRAKAPTERDATHDVRSGPVLFAYDGTELAALAIEEAGRQLEDGRDALIACVWQPADVGFVPVGGQHFDADDAVAVGEAAEATAAHGAALAESRRASAPRVACAKAAPTWKGIVDVAEQHGASLIVIGSHERHGLAGHLAGSVTRDLLAHTALSGPRRAPADGTGEHDGARVGRVSTGVTGAGPSRRPPPVELQIPGAP